MYNDEGTHAQRGYEPTNYSDGGICNGGFARACIVEGARESYAIESAIGLVYAPFRAAATVLDAFTGRGFNPFEGKTPEQIDKMFRDKGFEPRGPDPISGKGGYVNPKTGRSYHLDPKNSFGEPAHVDVNRLRGYDGFLDKRKFPMGE